MRIMVLVMSDDHFLCRLKDFTYTTRLFVPPTGLMLKTRVFVEVRATNLTQRYVRHSFSGEIYLNAFSKLRDNFSFVFCEDLMFSWIVAMQPLVLTQSTAHPLTSLSGKCGGLHLCYIETFSMMHQNFNSY